MLFLCVVRRVKGRTQTKVVDDINVHLGLSALPVIGANQVVLFGQIPTDGPRFGQHFAIKL